MGTVQDADRKQGQSPWAFRIATVSGIPIRIHFTFVLFLIWIAIAGQRGMWPLLVIALFACVILHELGHALTAQHYGVGTRDITLYPIGGVAMLQGRPKPRQELWIALAGPMVNVVIAALLVPAIFLIEHRPPDLVIALSGNFLQGVFAANVALAAFNLLPAFPMDGGRVLRAALALAMPEAKATQIAAAIGQSLAIVFGIVGLFTGQIILMLIAFFVFLGAGQEANASVTRSFLEGHTVRDAMLTRFRTIENGATLEGAASMLLAGSQHDFPVVAGDETVGLLTRSDIARGLAADGPSAYVAAHMRRDTRTVEPGAPLDQAVDIFTQEDGAPLLVMEGDRLAGMLTQENLSEFIMLQAARQRGAR